MGGTASPRPIGRGAAGKIQPRQWAPSGAGLLERMAGRHAPVPPDTVGNAPRQRPVPLLEQHPCYHHTSIPLPRPGHPGTSLCPPVPPCALRYLPVPSGTLPGLLQLLPIPAAPLVPPTPACVYPRCPHTSRELHPAPCTLSMPRVSALDAVAAGPPGSTPVPPAGVIPIGAHGMGRPLPSRAPPRDGGTGTETGGMRMRCRCHEWDLVPCGAAPPGDRKSVV